ncbi:MAG: hypothetical protein ABI325_07640 [Ginsengibacter sp.]
MGNKVLGLHHITAIEGDLKKKPEILHKNPEAKTGEKDGQF